MIIPKLSKYETNKLTKEELKAIILTYHYPFLKKHSKKETEIWKTNFEERELIETRIKNNYNDIGTIIFSINGSPPKGIGIILIDDLKKEEIKGNLILIGHSRTSMSYYIELKE